MIDYSLAIRFQDDYRKIKVIYECNLTQDSLLLISSAKTLIKKLRWGVYL